jgi:protocatechuate 3,4-dioxygenase, beta subunit
LGLAAHSASTVYCWLFAVYSLLVKSRKLFFVLLLLLALAPTAFAQDTASSEPRFTPPPGEETPAIKSLIDRAGVSLAENKTTSSTLLTNPEYMSAHEWPRFRKLIREHAQTNQVTMVTSQEPGDALVVKGTIRDSRGGPIKGALVYVYQTSAKGWYSDKAPHISGNSGDEKYARLFGYLTTNTDGQYEIRTIRPAGYPRSNLPAHIHIEIEFREPAKTTANAAVDNERRTLISEIQFEDDPRLTAEMRSRSARDGSRIFPVTRSADGVQHVKADFQVK